MRKRAVALIGLVYCAEGFAGCGEGEAAFMHPSWGTFDKTAQRQNLDTDTKFRLENAASDMKRLFALSEDGKTVRLPFTADSSHTGLVDISIRTGGYRIRAGQAEVASAIEGAEQGNAKALQALKRSSNASFESAADRERLIKAQESARDAIAALKGRATDLSAAEVRQLLETRDHSEAIAARSTGTGIVSRNQATVALSQSRAIASSAACLQLRQTDAATHLTVNVTLARKDGKPVHGAKVYAVSAWVWEGRTFPANRSEFKLQKTKNVFLKETTPSQALLPRTETIRIWAEMNPGVELASSEDIPLCAVANAAMVVNLVAKQ